MLQLSAYLFAAYPVTYGIANLIWPSFYEITPQHKKMYVISNLLKGFCFGYIMLTNLDLLLELLYYHIWNADKIKNMAIQSHGPPGIAFRAGEGVGTVTKPGLPIPPGQPAINPVPRQMMTAEVEALAAEYGMGQ